MTASAGSLKAREWIECALNEVVKEVAKGTDGKPCIELKRIEGYEARVDKHLASTQFMTKDHKVTYCWPGKTADEAWRFSCVVSVLNAMHAAICANVTVTKRFGLFTAPSGGGTNMWARDIFYGEPELFGDQVIVDSLIDDIVHTCQVRREDLHVTASPKGLFVSPCANRGEVQSIASDSVFKTSPAWILVMEKEATFNSLHQSNFHHCHQAGPGLLVTGKGYPDIATRHFLRWCIGSTDHAPQIFGLFDFDAYGVDILKTYRIGSKASATELHRNLPEIKWLGIKSEDIIQLPSSAALMPLTQKDRRKAIKVIESAVLEQGGTVEELLDCREELQRMLMLNKKAEIQVLEDRLCRWAERKMLEAMRDST